jgi:hypothetical protein
MRRTVRLFLRSRRRQITLAVLLGAAGAILLVAGAQVSGYSQDIMVNLGASFVMVALSFIVFDPVFEEMRRNAVEEHRTLNHDQLVNHIAAARTQVAILETWSGLLEDRYRDRFATAVTAAVRRGVEIRVLLLDPDSAAALQRAEELRQPQVPVLIMENLQHLYHLRGRLDSAGAQQLQVRIYDASPAIQLYRWDDKALVSFFPVGVRAYDARQIEAYMDSSLGEFVNTRFEALWTDPSTRRLTEFMRLGITVRLDGADSIDLASGEADFVTTDQECYLDGAALLDHLTDHGVRRLRVATQRPVAAAGRLSSAFGMVRLDLNDHARRAGVVALFDAKYGGRHDQAVLLRLVPAHPDIDPARSNPVAGSLPLSD